MWEKLYTIKEAAAMLKVSPWTIRSWLTRGRLCRTKVGSRTVIRASQLRRVVCDAPKVEAESGNK